MSEEKFIVYSGNTVRLVKGADGLWRADNGTIFALTDNSASVDSVDRCGISIFSLPADLSITDACKAHDYAYSSPAYQLFHTRAEADEMLRRNIELLGEGKWYSILATPFYYLARIFGGFGGKLKLWENKKTR